MTSHTHEATTSPHSVRDEVTCLCVACQVADGRRHDHPLDHLGQHGIDCICDCHESETQHAVFGEQTWELIALTSQRTCRPFWERGPPRMLAA